MTVRPAVQRRVQLPSAPRRLAAVGPATLHRRFRARLGTAPHGWPTERRITLACRMTGRGEERLDVVARAGGPGTATNLWTRFRRRTGPTSGEYRRRFTPTR
ncbi:helix-turn-helix domain-containing protein [Streptomyces sp. NPDC093149]|uniref:helix-turn-helix domain-containing protein n=1 Tax=Streptomyces sp. NPDC093149 TaxID=3366031 RepID=UPI0037F81CF5